jgi:hypothetical protein
MTTKVLYLTDDNQTGIGFLGPSLSEIWLWNAYLEFTNREGIYEDKKLVENDELLGGTDED